MDIAQAESLVGRRVSARLLAHSLRVADTAADLARRWSGDETDAHLAGLLHDLCREWSAEELLRAAQNHSLKVGRIERRYPVQLLHGPVAAAELVREGLGASALAAIALHTVGGPGMDVVARSVYVADFCEPGRRFAGAAAVRSLALRSLDEAVAATVRMTMQYLVDKRTAPCFRRPWRCTTNRMGMGSGYRTQRLRERRAERGRRLQLAALVLVAAAVALAAVFGAAYIARQLTAKHPAKVDLGYVGLVTVGAGEPGRQPVAYLVICNRSLGVYRVFAVPRALLLEGPQGEYVMAGDLIGHAGLRALREPCHRCGHRFPGRLAIQGAGVLVGQRQRVGHAQGVGRPAHG